jgi:uncharacterized membrane protein (UPF0127 family)
MKVKAQDVLNVVDTVDSADDLDSILSLTVDDAIQLALRKSANTRLEPVWYEKILAKLGDHEKEMFTLGLASSGIKVVPAAITRKRADLDIESHTNRIKKHLEKLVADKGYVSEDEYRDALWDKAINGNVPDKVVGDINAWLMQSMIPLKKNKPKNDVTPGYRKKVMDQLKHPNVNTFKASKMVARHAVRKGIRASRLYSITALLDEHADYRLSKSDKRVIVSFVDRKADESTLLASNGKRLRIEVPLGGGVIATWSGDKIDIGNLAARSEQTVVNYLRKVAPKNFFAREAQATDFLGEQSELERAIMSWEPRLKNIKEWLGDVARAKNFGDLKKLWDRLWATKEEMAFEIDPRKHDFKEYVDFGEDDGESLELTSAMDGAEGDEDVDKYQQAYNAVGGNSEKMISWLKNNKGVDTTAKVELKNAIQDWLKNHKKTAAQEFYGSMGRALVTIGKNRFLVHIADTPAQKVAGLEVATKIGDNEGMLFPFEPAQHTTFHMGSVKFPLDIIFLMEDAEGFRLNKIVHDVWPGDDKKYSDNNVTAVLELKGNTCKRLGIKRGDICDIKIRVSAKFKVELR